MFSLPGIVYVSSFFMDLHANPVPDAFSGTDYFRTRCFPVDQVQHVADQIRASIQIQYRLMVVGEDDLAAYLPRRFCANTFRMQTFLSKLQISIHFTPV